MKINPTACGKAAVGSYLLFMILMVVATPFAGMPPLINIIKYSVCYFATGYFFASFYNTQLRKKSR